MLCDSGQMVGQFCWHVSAITQHSLAKHCVALQGGKAEKLAFNRNDPVHRSGALARHVSNSSQHSEVEQAVPRQ